MSDLQRLQNWFDSGRLIRPSAEVLNFVDLIRALARLGGAQDVPGGPGVETLTRTIGEAGHYVFVVVDGMGMNLVETLPEGAFLPGRIVGEVRSVFLSTTACALTTLATGEWPAVHAVPGWWTYLEEFELTAVTLPFVERATKLSLTELDVEPRKVFPTPSIWPRLTREMLMVLPERIRNSVYSTYSTGGTLQAGYADSREATALALKRVQNAREPTFTYVYLPQLDEAVHRHGTRHERVRDVLLSLDRQLSDLARVLAGRARLIITADHGLADVTEDRRFILPEDDPIRAHLVCRPTGDATVPIFHVHQGHSEAFRAEFAERFGEYYALLTPQELEGLHLLGPEPLSRTMRRRLGTFVGIAPDPTVLAIAPCRGAARHIGVHGGLSAAEMHLPLIVA